MKNVFLFSGILYFCLFSKEKINAQSRSGELGIHTSVDDWPREPSPYLDFDWKKRFLDFDSYIFDWNKKSTFPTIKWDLTHYNMSTKTIAIPAYYGDVRLYHDGWTDALTIIADVVGSTLCGRKKDSVVVDGQVYNYVDMLRTFKHQYKNRKTVYNWPDPKHVRIHSDWWYDAGPSLLYFMVGNLYPNENGMDKNLREIADSYYDMVQNLGGEKPDFWHQAYNFDDNRPVDSINWNGQNLKWKCPEAGVVTALIEYWAFQKFGDVKYLKAAKSCMDYFENLKRNPYYEMGISFGPYIAARMNAETGTHYDVGKYINWLLKGSDVRKGYGTSESNWNGYDTYGLVGSRRDNGGEGYVFGLETFANAFLAPAVKYNPQLARTVAKWLLNAGNAARFFYADQLPADHQFYGSKYIKADENVIPYEGLRYSEEGQSPRATGDPVSYNALWAKLGPSFDVGKQVTNLALYDGAWAGFFGAILQNTNVSKILQIDLNKLDFFKSGKSYPSYLYYNPYTSSKKIEINLASGSDLFDVLSGKFIARNVTGKYYFTIPADEVTFLVICPSKSKLKHKGNEILINNIPVAFNTPVNKKAD